MVETAAPFEQAGQRRQKLGLVAALHPGGIRQFFQLYHSGLHFALNPGDRSFGDGPFRLIQTFPQIFVREIIAAARSHGQRRDNQ